MPAQGRTMASPAPIMMRCCTAREARGERFCRYRRLVRQHGPVRPKHQKMLDMAP